MDCHVRQPFLLKQPIIVRSNLMPDLNKLHSLHIKTATNIQGMFSRVSLTLRKFVYEKNLHEQPLADNEQYSDGIGFLETLAVTKSDVLTFCINALKKELEKQQSDLADSVLAVSEVTRLVVEANEAIAKAFKKLAPYITSKEVPAIQAKLSQLYSLYQASAMELNKALSQLALNDSNKAVINYFETMPLLLARRRQYPTTVEQVDLLYPPTPNSNVVLKDAQQARQKPPESLATFGDDWVEVTDPNAVPPAPANGRLYTPPPSGQPSALQALGFLGGENSSFASSHSSWVDVGDATVVATP
jgi:hypothetical protein